MTDLAAQLWPALPLFFLAAACFVLAVLIGLFVVRRTELVLGADPPMPPVVHAEFTIDPDLPVAPNYHRGEYPVVPHIPGATPQAGPVCPVCGGPWHPVCPSAPKARTEEITVALAPQLAALGRFFSAVDEAQVDALRPDCPLTTQEIPPLLDAPDYDTTVRRTATRDLSALMEKVKHA
jgi:hypothetical protein